jgi:Ca2+-binding RTX toxin-like protein
VIDAGDGNNTVYGGSGNDRIVSGSGNDLLIGGKGGDTYVISSFGSDSDTIVDNGNAALKKYGWLTWNVDEVEFADFSSLDAAKHGLDIQILGSDLILTYWNAATPGVSGQITVQDHFLGSKFALEQVDFGIGDVNGIYHIAQLSGDDYTYSVHGGSDAGGNDIVLGTLGDDKMYGGLGGDIMVGGGGADLYIFHDEEDGGGSTDLILDFDITDDLFDFSEIKGLDFSGVTISNSAYGNALISTAYGSVELVGVAFDTVTEDAFVFNGTTPAPDPGPGPAPGPGPTPGGVRITGTAGADELVGTDFADRFIFTADTAFDAVDAVKDFLVEHGDTLDITDLLIGYDPANDAISDFAMLIRDPESDDVILAIDRDGTAAVYGAQDVALIVDGASLDIQALFDDGLLLA